jgi:hypothetical protein
MTRSTILFVFIAASLATAARAEECRSLKSVKSSAESVSANTTAGGHVTIHIKGNDTKINKEQYASEEKFKEAWTAFEAVESGALTKKPADCGGTATTAKDCIPFAKLRTPKKGSDLVQVGWQCTGLKDGTTGETRPCFKWEKKEIAAWAFWYLKVSGTWILQTSFPSSKADCAAPAN